MMRKLLWRASLAFVLHCTPAMADHIQALLAMPATRIVTVHSNAVKPLVAQFRSAVA